MLRGKQGLIMGVANQRSLAWAIASACRAAGAELALSYAGERMEKPVKALAEELGGATRTLPCDVTDDAQVEALFRELEAGGAGLDFVVHAIAGADPEDLARPYVETPRAGYHLAQDVSSYSLTAVCRRAAPLLAARGGGAVLTLSFLGSTRVIPNYNVMGVAKAALEASVRYLAHDLGEQGIRVNAVSAGPVKTVSARGIRDFSRMLEHHREWAPLRRNVEPREVADAAVFLLSGMASGITGEVLHVDCGYHVR